jgi:cytochrome c-type biogenesis protein CcmH/NrfF
MRLQEEKRKENKKEKPGARQITNLLKCLSCKLEDLSSSLATEV